MKVSFKDRLQQAINENNIKPIDLANKTKLSKSLISGYLNGKYLARQDKLSILANALNVSEAWLMGYDVSMSKQNLKLESNVFPNADSVIEIPVVGKISAGMPLLAVENIVSYAYAPSSQIKQGYTYFYLTVQGDSMNLKFHEGDIILVQKQSDLENDEIGVILINGEATVKKYKNENGLIILQPMSTNPEHQVQIYNPKEKDIEIIGKVISYQGKV